MAEESLADMLEKMGKEMEEQRKTSKIGNEIKFPITVKGIHYRVAPAIQDASRFSRQEGGPGTLVQVRSCRPEHGEKTRLGILVGYVPNNTFAVLRHEEGKPQEGMLEVLVTGDNPLIFIPELKCCVMGEESWWGPIENESQLKQITDEDILNVPYVQLLKAMAQEQLKKDDKKDEGK